MSEIAIMGAGISGLTLALRLQQYGVETTLYSERTADQLRSGRLPNSVVRFHPTRERERELGVDHWDFPDFGVDAVHLTVSGEHPLAFHGKLSHQASAVDFRIYLARLLEDYENRGGHVVFGPLSVSDAVRHARSGHDLTIVATGWKGLTQLFPREPKRSPFERPQRLLCAGLYEGIALPDPIGVSFTVVPGVGEIFQTPFFSFAGRVSALMFEAIPGSPLEVLRHLGHEDDPARFEATVLKLLERYAPTLRARVSVPEFRLTRPADLLQGELTPAVRRAWVSLGGERHAMAVGDAWVLNDPVTGQGANLGSHSAWTLAEAILDGGPYDERFCRAVEARMWTYAESVCAFTNAFLEPPLPQVAGLLAAAAHDQALADAFIDNFADPPAMWRMLTSPPVPTTN